MAVGQHVVPVFGLVGHLVPVTCATTPVTGVVGK